MNAVPSRAAAAFIGPLELQSFPERISARVVKADAEPRVHGYSVQGDLARYYGVADLWLLCLTGELPEPALARAFSVACWFLAPVSVADASVHAAVLARLCGTPPSATIATAALSLAEQARFEVESLGDLLEFLSSRSGELPAHHRAQTPAQCQELEPLLAALRLNAAPFPEIGHRPTLTAALFAILFECGLKSSEQLQAALVFARLPIATAEAFAEQRCNFRQYPANLPRYEYEP
ncbi:MAG TPA: hypothetical protein VFQ61_26270 [Polyangiaceae bacterium]|nr:hypothetical protein [Polyangiaceae bacterium]